MSPSELSFRMRRMADRLWSSVQTRRARPPRARGFDAVVLEDRVMLSATPMPDVPVDPDAAGRDDLLSADPFIVDPQVDVGTDDGFLFSDTPDDLGRDAAVGIDPLTFEPVVEGENTVEVQRLELVFLDAAAKDYELLLDDLLANQDPQRALDIHVLEKDRDGIEQISEVLAGYSDVSAIHIVSHGDAGRVNLGSTWLDAYNLDAHAGQIAGWNTALRSGSDLLIYGCDLASSSDGETLVEAIGTLCGCDVAASNDDTGHLSLGGDWELEHASGSIETDVAFSTHLQETWNHLLNVTSDNTSTGTAAEEASSVTISHTTSGANRLLLVGISFGEDEGDSVSSVSYNGTALTLIGARDHSDSSQARVEIWGLVAPDTGTHDVIVNFNGDDHGGATVGVTSFTGVDQFDPWGAFASSEGQSTNLSTTVASAPGQLVFGVAALDKSSDVTLTPGPGQTGAWELFRGKANGAGSTEAGAASVVTSWTSSDSGKWVVAGVSIKKATAGEGLWLSTTDDVDSPSGVPGVDAWGKDEVLTFGGSTLAFEPGTTSGTLRSTSSLDSLADDGNVDVDALHYVSTELTIGGANSITLQVGDLLISTADDEDFASGTFSAKKEDLFLFRPTSSGDYSSGTFQMVLDLNSPLLVDPDLNFGDMWAATLVEQNTTIGDVTVDAGDFLFSRDGGSEHQDVWVFDVADVGLGTTDGSADRLLEGSDLGFTDKIFGLELIENTITVGGRTLSAGTLLVALDGDTTVLDDDADPSNDLVVSKQDVFALEIAQTTLGGGTTVATSASLFFEGADTGFDDGKEQLDALTLVLSNSSPSFDSDTTPNVNENQTVVQTLSASDADMDPVTFSITGGADAALFEITGMDELVFLTAPDYEAPSDADSDNIYEVEVTAADGNGGTTIQTISVTVDPVNDNNPAFTTGSMPSIAENTTFVLNVNATDADLPAQTLTYSIVGGADMALFDIDGMSGSLSFLAAPDFESPTDAGGDNVYEVDVQASDGAGGATVQSLLVTVTDLVELLVVDTASDILDGDTSSIGALVADKGSDGFISLREAIIAANNTAGLDTISFNIAGGGGVQTILVGNAADGGNGLLPTITEAVSIDGLTQPGASPNTLPTGNNANLTIELDGTFAGATATGLRLSGAGASGSTIRGLVINRFSDEGIEVSNADDVTIQGNFIGTDATGSVAAGNGGHGIEINTGSTGVLVGGSMPDARNVISGNTADGLHIADAGTVAVVLGNFIGTDAAGTGSLGNGSNGIEIRSAGNQIGGALPGEANVIAASGGPGINLTGDDADDNRIQGNFIGTNFSGDAGLGNGQWGIIAAFSADRNIIGTDGDGLNDAAEGNVISGNTWEGISIQTADDNVIAGNLIGTTPDGADALANGAGGVWITGTSAGNRVGTDNNGTSDALERNVISGNGGAGVEFSGNAANNSVAGNYIGTQVDGVSALGNNGSGVRFNGTAGGNKIGGTASSVLANIIAFNAGDGVTVASSNGNSVRANSIFSNAGLGIDLQGGAEDAFGVTDNDLLVLDLDGGPNRLQNYPELQTAVTTGSDIAVTGTLDSTALTTFEIDLFVSAAGDPSGHGEGLTYLGTKTVTTGALGTASFTFNQATSVPAGAVISATATNMSTGDTSEFSLNILATSSNNAPVITFDPTPSINENSTVVQTLTATDADMDPVAFSITGGDDAGLFTINGANQLVFLSPPDYEAPGDGNGNNVYEVQITADDGNGVVVAQLVSVTVNPLNDHGPVFTSSSTPTVVENTATVLTLTASDADLPGQTISFSITGGDDDGLFTINGSDELEFLAAPDYETPLDADGDNVYEVQITADDGNGGTTVQSISVTVTPANDNAPVFTSSSTPVVAENTTTVLMLTASDADLPGQTISFSITGGDDAGLFAINGSNELEFLAAPDFEAPLDADGDNVYELEVTADDGNGGTTIQSISVRVSNANESPMITSPAAANVTENTTTAMTATSSDPDGGAPVYSIVGGADAASFAIDGSTGELTFIVAPNFEVPADADSDNIYQVQIKVDDGNGGSDTQLVSLTIVDANDAPVAADAAYSVANTETLDVAAPGLLLSASDEDGNPLTPALVTGTAHGTLTLNADGSFTYSPDAGFVGTDSFQYVVNDGSGNSNVATVLLAVTSGPSPIPAPAPVDTPPIEDSPEPPEETPAEETPVSPVEDKEAKGPSSTPRDRREPLGASIDPAFATLVLTELPRSEETAGLGDELIEKFQRSVEQLMPTVAVEVLERFAVAFDAGLLWQDLSDLQSELNGEDQLAYLAAGSAATFSSMLTAGYVLWTIRGGWLASSLLAQMPAWRLIDPLVVLDQLDGHSSRRSDENPDDDDSLESLLADSDSSQDAAPSEDDRADTTVDDSQQPEKDGLAKCSS